MYLQIGDLFQMDDDVYPCLLVQFDSGIVNLFDLHSFNRYDGKGVAVKDLHAVTHAEMNQLAGPHRWKLLCQFPDVPIVPEGDKYVRL